MKTRPQRNYYYRGLIARGSPASGYRWIEGYSANSSSGDVIYPWMPKRQCKSEAKEDGFKAIFKHK